MSDSPASLPYHEPGIVTILILASFLLLQNAVNFILDHLVYCGLIGQIAIGVAWGTPGADWLSRDVQSAIVQLGYLGLILLVYEGGLQTNIKALRSNLLLSSLVAVIGISAPIGLSFTLQGLMQDVTPVQGFAAGAALCSTSLGTTFTILSTSGLSQSRLGVVLSSAALMDDIVGLVMSGVISNLGQPSAFEATTVIRPVFVSIAFAILLPVICVYILRPVTKLCFRSETLSKVAQLRSGASLEAIALICHILVLLVLVSGASFAGTSNLFAAYLAGATIAWWDGLYAELQQPVAQEIVSNQDSLSSFEPGDTTVSQNCLSAEQGNDGSAGAFKAYQQSASSVQETLHTSAFDKQNSEQGKYVPTEHEQKDSVPSTQTKGTPVNTGGNSCDQAEKEVSDKKQTWKSLTGVAIFDKNIHPALQTVLKPFFFASIGFSIPISQMFTGAIIWRGLVYSILMIIAKLLCGLCLVRFTGPVISSHWLKSAARNSIPACMSWPIGAKISQNQHNNMRATQPTSNAEDDRVSVSIPSQRLVNATRIGSLEKSKHFSVIKPKSLYAAALLGSAMVARGEIGFLISAVAESNRVFGPPDAGSSSELFLVVTWAILLCTIVGPLTIGLLVKRVKRLQQSERSKHTGREDPLGIWGISL